MRLTVGLAVLLATPGSLYAGENLLRDGGFEADMTSWNATGTVQAIQRADWHSRSGRSSFGAGNDAGPYGAWMTLSQDVALPQPLLASRRCTFVVWVMAERNCTGDLSIKLDFLDSEGRSVGTSKSVFLQKTRGKWKEKRLSDVAPRGTKTIRATCRSENVEPGGGLSFVWFDDASLTLE